MEKNDDVSADDASVLTLDTNSGDNFRVLVFLNSFYLI
jgi:hypothetical protein